MLQQDRPEDYVIATGEQHSVREFATRAAGALGLTLRWEREDTAETGMVAAIDAAAGLPKSARALVGRTVVRVDPRYFRPTEVETLLGDAGKAREKLGWTPRTSFAELVAAMAREDLRQAQRDALVKSAGYRAFDHQE
jgi:GDPmannose 4,6-dehydratase